MLTKSLHPGVLILLLCGCLPARSDDAPAVADHDMHDMHDMRAMGDDTPGADLAGMSLEFELVGHSGEPVRDDDFRGKNVLLTFGFTHCAHICPLTAATMANTLEIADKESVGVFISIDSERDTPAITHSYASHFGPRMIGLSGSYEQLAAAAKNFNVTFVVTKTQNDYTVQHTPGIYLIGPDGGFIDVFAINSRPADIVAAMK